MTYALILTEKIYQRTECQYCYSLFYFVNNVILTIVFIREMSHFVYTIVHPVGMYGT